MKRFAFFLSALTANFLIAAENLPVDENKFLKGHVDFVQPRHKSEREALLRPPVKTYPFTKNEIKWENGLPVIYSDNKPLTMFSGQLMAATNGNPLSARKLREAGVNVFLVDVNYVHSKNIYSGKYPKDASPEKMFQRFKVNADALLKSAPDAKIIIRIWASFEGDDFREKYPDALLTEPDGNTKWRGNRYHANALTEWKLYLAKRVRRFLELAGESNLAPSIVGVYIGALNTGEWWYHKSGNFHWDYSRTRQEAFRHYLNLKYGKDGLRELVKFYKAKDVNDLFRLPSLQERAKGAYPCTRNGDYLQVLNLPMTNAAKYLAGVIKAVSGGKLLAGMEILSDMNVMNVNGTVFTQQLLQCPDIDFLGAPSPYPLRKTGGYSPNRAVDTSLFINKKMFLAEEDFRTHGTYGTLAGQGCPAPTPQKSAQMLRRQGVAAFLKGHNGYLMEFGGQWFTHPEILREISRINQMRDVVRKFATPRRTEIAVVTDQESQLYGNYFANPTEFRVKQLAFIGADHDFYELSDFLKPEVYKKYKLVIFLNILALSNEERRGIEQLKSDGRSLLFFYNPGGINLSSLNHYDPAALTGLTSFKVTKNTSRIPWGKVVLSAHNGNMKKYLGISGKDFHIGDIRKIRKNELAAVDQQSLFAGTYMSAWEIKDPQAVPLAVFSDKTVRFAMKKHENWTAYYSASCQLPANIVRAVAEKAGCHIANKQGDVIFQRGPFLSLHAAFKGKHIITFPSDENVLECFSGKIITPKNKQYEFNADRGQTFLFYQGKSLADVRTAIIRTAQEHNAEIAKFRKNVPSPKAAPGWVQYARSVARPKKNGPLPIRYFVPSAMLLAGPFASFEQTEKDMLNVKVLKRMPKEPKLPVRSIEYATLNALLKRIPDQKPGVFQWQAFNTSVWNMLQSFGIAKGQTGLFAFYLSVPEETIATVYFAADSRASVAINSKILSEKKEFTQKIKLNAGFNLVTIAAENTTGENGFTLKFMQKDLPVEPAYEPAYAAHALKKAAVYLEK